MLGSVTVISIVPSNSSILWFDSNTEDEKTTSEEVYSL